MVYFIRDSQRPFLLCLSTLHGPVIFPQRCFVAAHPAASGVPGTGSKMADVSVNESVRGDTSNYTAPR